MATTLRSIKKHSKFAVGVLVAHYGLKAEDVFPAQKGENYHGLVIRCTHGAGDPCLVPGRRRCDCTYHPLPGTPMTGEMSGYYEPEWEERPTIQTLAEYVLWGDKPETMTDREWRRVLNVTGTRPLSAADIEEMSRDDDDDEASPLPAAQGGR